MLKYLLGAEWTVLVDLEEKLAKIPKSLKGSLYLSYRFFQWCFGGFLCGKEILLSLGCLKTTSRKTTQNLWGRSISNFDNIFLISWGDKGSLSSWKDRKKKKALREERSSLLFNASAQFLNQNYFGEKGEMKNPCYAMKWHDTFPLAYKRTI